MTYLSLRYAFLMDANHRGRPVVPGRRVGIKRRRRVLPISEEETNFSIGVQSEVDYFLFPLFLASCAMMIYAVKVDLLQ